MIDDLSKRVLGDEVPRELARIEREEPARHAALYALHFIATLAVSRGVGVARGLDVAQASSILFPNGTPILVSLEDALDKRGQQALHAAVAIMIMTTPARFLVGRQSSDRLEPDPAEALYRGMLGVDTSLSGYGRDDSISSDTQESPREPATTSNEGDSLDKERSDLREVTGEPGGRSRGGGARGGGGGGPSYYF